MIQFVVSSCSIITPISQGQLGKSDFKCVIGQGRLSLKNMHNTYKLDQAWGRGRERSSSLPLHHCPYLFYPPPHTHTRVRALLLGVGELHLCLSSNLLASEYVLQSFFPPYSNSPDSLVHPSLPPLPAPLRLSPFIHALSHSFFPFAPSFFCFTNGHSSSDSNCNNPDQVA